VESRALIVIADQNFIGVIMLPASLNEFYLWSKVVAAVGSAAGVIYGVISWLRAAYHQVKKTNENMELLMGNHLPHIQSSLDSHGDALSVLSSDIRDVGTKVDGMEKRQEDLRRGVHTLGESFLRHLETVSAEPKSRKKSRR
jgi:hypothetical protein